MELSFHANSSFDVQVTNRKKALVKSFLSSSYEIVNLKPSKIGYNGSKLAMKQLYDMFVKNKIDPKSIFVIGTKYKKIPCGGRYGYGDDIQVISGGKCKYGEDHEDAVSREMLEETNFIGSNFIKLNESIQKNVHTKIFSICAMECKNHDENHDYINQRADNFRKKIGFIIWGTYDDCINLVASSTMTENTEDLLEGYAIVNFLDAYSIICD